ncbi:MAG: cobalt transporter CbiM [Nitrospirota bacterium]|nr:cobalt transporter CbiM [Nitrospirota bacterium]
MHIPDGYLSPATWGSLYAAMIPVWGMASRWAKKHLKTKQAPYLALGAAFSFVIMMFNIPIPGGTTGHAAGMVLVAILLGPWAAVLAITVALAIQALVFGDGGITALAANCFNIAFAGSFAGYWTYRLIAGKSETTGKRRITASAVAGYVGINVSALLTAVELGIQPLIAVSATGQPLYAPYPLSVAVPVMMGEHLLLFGFVEAAVTALVVRYIQQTDPKMLASFHLASTRA